MSGRMPRGDQVLLRRVGHQVAGGFAGVDIEARDAPRMVVVEHQPGTLLVGVEERNGPIARIGHVGNILDTDTFRILGDFPRGRGPLVRRAVADPGREAAMQVQGRAVLGEVLQTMLMAVSVAGTTPDPPRA